MSNSAPEREQRLGAIDTAYCYETETMDGPYLGRDKFANKPHPHYFCVTEGCAYLMRRFHVRLVMLPDSDQQA